MSSILKNKPETGSVLPPPCPTNILWQLLEWIFRVLDWGRLPQFLMFLNETFKTNTRPLDARERELAQLIFRQSIDLQKVRLDERSYIGCRQWHFAYVGFYYINAWGRLDDATLIHELVHVWQYQNLGAVYIPRALFAQHSEMGYCYGGIETLRAARSAGKNLLDFNYEQQADIVADYFRLKNGYAPRWCAFDPAYLPDFEYFMKIFWKKQGQYYL